MTESEYEYIISQQKMSNAQAALAVESHKYSELAEKLRQYTTILLNIQNGIKLTATELGDMATGEIGDCNAKEGTIVAEVAGRLRNDLIKSFGLNIDELDAVIDGMEKSTMHIRCNPSNCNNSDFIDAAYAALNKSDYTLLRKIFPDMIEGNSCINIIKEEM
jgi:hypothetical protein